MKNTILLASCAFIFFSCEKEEPVQAFIPPTTIELLAGTTSKSWLLTRLTSRLTAGDAIVDVQDELAKLEPCQLDNVYVFYTNNTLEVKEGASACNPATTGVVTTSRWSANTDKSPSLHTDLLPDLQVLSLTKNSLAGVYYAGGRTYSFSFTKQ